MSDVETTWPQVFARRLRLLSVTDPSPDVVTTASRLIGLHAQVISSTDLSAALRTPAHRQGDLDAALWQNRTLVRTWGMRGTLHLFPTAEFPALVAAFAQRQWPKFTPGWEKYHGITGDDVRLVTEAVGEVLSGQILTREELTAAVAAHLKRRDLAEVMQSGWGQVLKPAAAGGLLCSGPDDGRNVTFTSPRTWIPAAPWDDQPDTDAALASIIRRFLDVYGPATHQDFGRWWGIDPASARKLFNLYGDAMAEITVEGEKAYATPQAAEQLTSGSGTGGTDGDVWLLPGFDPYVIAPISHRAHSIPDGYVDHVSRTAGWISPVLLVDGVVRGTWQYEVSKGALTITITGFDDVSAYAKTAAAAHAERYAEFFEAALNLVWQ